MYGIFSSRTIKIFSQPTSTSTGLHVAHLRGPAYALPCSRPLRASGPPLQQVAFVRPTSSASDKCHTFKIKERERAEGARSSAFYQCAEGPSPLICKHACAHLSYVAKSQPLSSLKKKRRNFFVQWALNLRNVRCLGPSRAKPSALWCLNWPCFFWYSGSKASCSCHYNNFLCIILYLLTRMSYSCPNLLTCKS